MEDRAAELTTISIVIVLRIGNLAAGDSTFRIQVAVLEILIDATAEFVRAGKNGGAELATRGVPKLGRELVCNQSKVADGIVGQIDEWTREGLVIVVNALDFEVVVTGTLAANCWTYADAETARGCNTGTEQRNIEHTAVAASGRTCAALSGGRHGGEFIVGERCAEILRRCVEQGAGIHTDLQRIAFVSRPTR